MNKQPVSRTCFLCGRENNIGLKMVWFNHPEEGKVRAVLEIPEHFNGYPGFVHGGIVAAILDETSGRAIMIDGGNDRLFVTASLEVKYRHPVPTNTTLTVTGWVIKGGSMRAKVAAEICLEDGKCLASCKATILRPPQEYYELWNWQQEKEHWKVPED
ncbi:MAG TPA: hypothetical protein DER60_05640 [Syntrophomonas sp.]|jgi:uncharacterized protein (TIGR00369 family)|nr:hypothetical protein [Syntrophomonas sp.]